MFGGGILRGAAAFLFICESMGPRAAAECAMSENLLLRLPASADVYLQKIDLTREAALLVQLGLDSYRAASFLDDRLLTSTTKGMWAPLSRVMDVALATAQAQPVHFIFHAGHVGSTLLSRLLDETGLVLSLREPLPLRTLADAHDVLNRPESLLSPSRFDSLRAALTKLWGRAYEGMQAVIVKATSSVGRLAPTLLSSDAAVRAVYLNLRAEPYLATLLAGENSVIDLRGHGPVRIRGLQARLATPLAGLHSMSKGELAAMSWLAEAWNERETIECVGERTLSVDFERLLAQLPESMNLILQHFGLSQKPCFLADISRSPVLSRYSKAAEFEYSPQVRAEILNQSRRDNREEILRGLRWLERVARSHPVADRLFGASDSAATSSTTSA